MSVDSCWLDIPVSSISSLPPFYPAIIHAFPTLSLALLPSFLVPSPAPLSLCPHSLPSSPFHSLAGWNLLSNLEESSLAIRPSVPPAFVSSSQIFTSELCTFTRRTKKEKREEGIKSMVFFSAFFLRYFDASQEKMGVESFKI